MSQDSIAPSRIPTNLYVAWPVIRPLPLRTSSELELAHNHVARAVPLRIRSQRLIERPTQDNLNAATSPRSHTLKASQATIVPHAETDRICGHRLSTLSPPSTPTAGSMTWDGKPADAMGPSDNTILHYDFSKIDYELSRATTLGAGLWSTVYLADAVRCDALKVTHEQITPPPSPRRTSASVSPSLFAVKTASSRTAISVFQQEARILTHLMRHSSSSSYIVPFHGLDTRNTSLIFEAIIGGSLEALNDRLKQMTELARHLELVSLFPSLASDLVGGLDFLHASGVIHADLKPANVLLDILEPTEYTKPVIRARYIDFSASFRRDVAEDTTVNAGGTWDYLAPEQMRLQPEWNTPTTASDVWSLGITLLTIIVGDSPYTAACNGNRMLLREAIKSADPVGFARHDPVVVKRLAACQDFVDCCRLALHKDRDRRATATSWQEWIIARERVL